MSNTRREAKKQDLAIEQSHQLEQEEEDKRSLMEKTWEEIYDFCHNILPTLYHSKPILHISNLERVLEAHIGDKLKINKNEPRPYIKAFGRLSIEEAKVCISSINMKFNEKIGGYFFSDFYSLTECFDLLLNMINLTQRSLANQVGTNGSNVSRFFESRNLKFSYILEIAQFFIEFRKEAQKMADEELAGQVEKFIHDMRIILDKYHRKFKHCNNNKDQYDTYKKELDALYATARRLYNSKLTEFYTPYATNKQTNNPEGTKNLAQTSTSLTPAKTEGFKPSSSRRKFNEKPSTSEKQVENKPSQVPFKETSYTGRKRHLDENQSSIPIPIKKQKRGLATESSQQAKQSSQPENVNLAQALTSLPPAKTEGFKHSLLFNKKTKQPGTSEEQAKNKCIPHNLQGVQKLLEPKIKQ